MDNKWYSVSWREAFLTRLRCGHRIILGYGHSSLSRLGGEDGFLLSHLLLAVISAAFATGLFPFVSYRSWLWNTLASTFVQGVSQRSLSLNGPSLQWQAGCAWCSADRRSTMDSRAARPPAGPESVGHIAQVPDRFFLTPICARETSCEFSVSAAPGRFSSTLLRSFCSSLVSVAIGFLVSFVPVFALFLKFSGSFSSLLYPHWGIVG
jgi:hypothetical protein